MPHGLAMLAAPRTNFQLARVFGIRVGVSASWFVVLFVLIYWLSPNTSTKILGGSQTTAYLVAVAGALGYFASLILHELGHALVARRLRHRRSRASTCGSSAASRSMRREPRPPARSSRSPPPARL